MHCRSTCTPSDDFIQSWGWPPIQLAAMTAWRGFCTPVLSLFMKLYRNLKTFFIDSIPIALYVCLAYTTHGSLCNNKDYCSFVVANRDCLSMHAYTLVCRQSLDWLGKIILDKQFLCRGWACGGDENQYWTLKRPNVKHHFPFGKEAILF